MIDEMLARLGRGETLHDYEARVRTKRGDIRVVHVSSNFQQKDGGTTRCFSRDVIEVHTETTPTPDSDWDIRRCIEVTKRRILVVDDNEDASGLLAEMLRSLGHEVVTAIDGPRALEVVNTFTPEIAILDIGLPVMDGYELAAALRQLMSTTVRLIAVSGYGQEQDKRRAIEAGFECHFVKPVSLQHVLAAIEVGSASTRS